MDRGQQFVVATGLGVQRREEGAVVAGEEPEGVVDDGAEVPEKRPGVHRFGRTENFAIGGRDQRRLRRPASVDTARRDAGLAGDRLDRETAHADLAEQCGGRVEDGAVRTAIAWPSGTGPLPTTALYDVRRPNGHQPVSSSTRCLASECRRRGWGCGFNRAASVRSPSTSARSWLRAMSSAMKMSSGGSSAATSTARLARTTSRITCRSGRLAKSLAR